jgi:hypothetical protein
MLVFEMLTAGFRLRLGLPVSASDSLDVVSTLEVSDDSVELLDSRSECARVYLVVVISSSSGVRKETRFSAGNIGRVEEPILRGIIARAGLLERMEVRL